MTATFSASFAAPSIKVLIRRRPQELTQHLRFLVPEEELVSFSPCQNLLASGGCRSVGMRRSNSVGTSWADQWDYGADPSPRTPRDGKDGGGRKQSGVEKTKAAAASGLRRVKEGTALGFQWIKDKCQKKNGGGGKKQGEQQGSEIAGY